MPYRTNTYYTDPAIARGVENLASALFGNPAQDAQLEFTLSRAKQIQDEVRRDRDARQRADTAADLFAQGDIPGAMSALVGTADPRYLPGLGDAALAFRANAPGATDDQIRRAFIGAGHNPAEHFASTAGRADTIAARDAASAMEEALAVQGLRNEGALGVQELRNAGALARAQLPDDDDGPDGIDWLEAQRRQELQGALQSEALNQLIDMGLPATKDGVRTDLLPQGMLAEITNEAWTSLMADMQAKRPTAPIGTYARAAIAKRIGGLEYTDDDVPILGFGDERLTIRKPQGATTPTPSTGPMNANATPATVPPPAQRVPGQVYQTPKGPMVWIVDPQTGRSGWAPGA